MKTKMNTLENESIKRIKNWLRGKKQKPVRIFIIPTNKCNLMCPFCYKNDKDIGSEELAKEKLISLVYEAKKMKVLFWDIMGGGEPFARRATMQMMEEIKKQGMMGNVTTNATLMTNELVERIVRMKWDYITISLDSSDEKTNDKLRGRGSYQGIIRALELLQRWKVELKSEKPVITLHTVLTNKNFRKLKGLFKIADQYGATTVNFTQLMNLSSSFEKLKLGPKQQKEFQKLIPGLKKEAAKRNILSNISSYKKEKLVSKSNAMNKVMKEENIKCYSPFTSMMILANGNVGPCCLYTPGKEIGNVVKDELKKIWFGKKAEGFRQMMMQGQLEECKNCPSTNVIENTMFQKAIKEGGFLRKLFRK